MIPFWEDVKKVDAELLELFVKLGSDGATVFLGMKLAKFSKLCTIFGW